MTNFDKFTPSMFEFNYPSSSFDQELEDTYYRAYYLLGNLNDDEILYLIDISELLIDQYYEKIENNEKLEVLDSFKCWNKNKSHKKTEALHTLKDYLNDPPPRNREINNALILTQELIIDIDQSSEYKHHHYLAAYTLYLCFQSSREYYFSTKKTDSKHLEGELYKLEYDIDEIISKVLSITTNLQFGIELCAIFALSALDCITTAEKLVTSNDAEVITIERIKESRSEQTRKAAEARHAGNRKLRTYAISCFLSDKWPSVLQAAKHIFPRMQEHAINEDIPPLSVDNGEKTVYGWLLKEKALHQRADV